MDRALKICGMIALLSVALVCVRLDVVLQRTGAELDALHAAAVSVKTTVDVINNQWLGKTGRLQQTIDELQYPIVQFGLTSKKEADVLDGWNKQMTQTLTDLDAAIGSVNRGTTAISSETVKAMRQVDTTVANVDPTLRESAKTLRSANRILSDANVAKTLKNTEQATQHLSDTAGDVQGAVHAYLHPGWKTRLFNWSMTAVHAVGGWF